MMAATSQAAFSVPVRVYWEDTDAAGIVFYANYLKFFERARTEWLRGFGFGQEELRRDGVAFVVSETTLHYLKPARLDDVVDVSVEVVHLGQASLHLAQQARRAGELLAEGTIRIGWVHAATLRPARMPPMILDRLNKNDS